MTKPAIYKESVTLQMGSSRHRPATFIRYTIKNTPLFLYFYYTSTMINVNDQLIHCALGPFKKLGNSTAQRLTFGGIGSSHLLDPLHRCRLRQFQGGQIAVQAGHPEHGQAGLAAAKEITWATQGQVLLRNLKAVGGFAQRL